MKKKNKTYYDRQTNKLDIKIGDLVFLEKEPHNKQIHIRTGPYKVLDIEDTNAIILMDKKKYTVHKNRLQIHIEK